MSEMMRGTGVVQSKKMSNAQKSGMTQEEWKAATKFDSTDWGWIIMSIGMAIGAGIVFLPVQVGLVGMWVFLISSIISYPAIYLFQKLFINTLAESPKCDDYPGVIGHYLGKNWGFLLGILYFCMIVLGVFTYSTAITNDSSSFLHSFGVTKTELSSNPFYGLIIICILVALASRGEKVLFKLSSGLVLIKLAVVAVLGVVMISQWDLANVSSIPDIGYIIKETIIMIPFTVTSILFIQSLSPMVISYRSHNKSIEVAKYKSLRAMNIAFVVLFVTVFFYAVSFNLAMGHDQAVIASEQNISALAMAAKGMHGNTLKILSLVLNIFSVMTAFFGVFLGFQESCKGIALNIMRRFIPEEKINKRLLTYGIIIFAILISWGTIILNLPVLRFLSLMGPLFGLIGCLIPAYLVYRVPFLEKYKGISLIYIIFVGIMLVISPFLDLW
ncbi:serine transporter [Fontibacillus solani]|uniref:Serine transporter n=1 Tax=Fontibacillus solani TaxID=1572857 RepID=A0A7W3XQ82_9BACL|nr:amino acid permease [Fontibacillus solani]MBA9084332.1 serine transporter [Fontibacillus solani]